MTNQVVNFGWEYVWHCHILSHEEMDMMRPQKLNVVTLQLADTPTVQAAGAPGSDVLVTWTDGTPAVIDDLLTWGRPQNEIGFRIERAVVTAGVPGTFEQIGTALANATSYTDTTRVPGTDYAYQVIVKNQAGEVTSEWVPPAVP